MDRALTLADVERATNTASARAVAESALEGTPWSIARLTRQDVRLNPPSDYRATYRVLIRREGQDDRRLTLVAKAWFGEDDREAYLKRLRDLYGEAPCRPLEGLGYPVWRPPVAWWFAPIDPELTTLAAASDGRSLRPLLAPRFSPKTPPARIRVETVRYVPESSAVLRYHVIDKAGREPKVYYGKLSRYGGGRALHATMTSLWALSQEVGGMLHVPEPVGYLEDLDLHVERAVAGGTLPSDRSDPAFLQGAIAAAEALAALHSSSLTTDEQLPLEPELARLERVTEQLMHVHPRAGALLRDLLKRLRAKVLKTAAEPQVFTHGDMKYDQFLVHEGTFTLVDFEDVGMSETSWDLGKWTAHAIPSMPESWEDSEGAERAREAFLDRYLALRPDSSLQRFALYEATHLANRAMVLMWGQREGWGPAAESLLALSMERLQDSRIS